MSKIIFSLAVAFGISTIAQDNESVRRKAAETKQRCTVAQSALQTYLNTLDHQCKVDTDCESRYYNAGSCEPPVILKKNAKIDEPQLVRFQNVVRTACADLLKGPACEPIPGYPVCYQNKCIDRSKLPAQKLPDLDTKLLKRPFKFGLARFSCAPHDAQSIEINLTQDPVACDKKINRRDLTILNVNIWQSDFVKGPTKGGDWGITSQSGIGSVCAGGGCSNLFSLIRIQVIDVQKEKFIRGKIEASTENGIKIPTQEFNVIWCPGSKLCG